MLIKIDMEISLYALRRWWYRCKVLRRGPESYLRRREGGDDRSRDGTWLEGNHKPILLFKFWQYDEALSWREAWEHLCKLKEPAK